MNITIEVKPNNTAKCGFNVHAAVIQAPFKYTAFYNGADVRADQIDISVRLQNEPVVPMTELDSQKLLVVCNFSDHEREFMPDREFREGKVLIRNLNNNNILDGMLEPYEAYVIYVD